jgi:hypothetical protein
VPKLAQNLLPPAQQRENVVTDHLNYTIRPEKVAFQPPTDLLPWQ